MRGRQEQQDTVPPDEQQNDEEQQVELSDNSDLDRFWSQQRHHLDCDETTLQGNEGQLELSNDAERFWSPQRHLESDAAQTGGVVYCEDDATAGSSLAGLTAAGPAAGIATGGPNDATHNGASADFVDDPISTGESLSSAALP
jgi:hypothetical protein